MSSIPMWIFGVVAIGALAYIYFYGGTDDFGENISIGFTLMLVGIILGGIFL